MYLQLFAIPVLRQGILSQGDYLPVLKLKDYHRVCVLLTVVSVRYCLNQMRPNNTAAISAKAIVRLSSNVLINGWSEYVCSSFTRGSHVKLFGYGQRPKMAGQFCRLCDKHPVARCMLNWAKRVPNTVQRDQDLTLCRFCLNLYCQGRKTALFSVGI
jgi:hypothetical protein